MIWLILQWLSIIVMVVSAYRVGRDRALAKHHKFMSQGFRILITRIDTHRTSELPDTELCATGGDITAAFGFDRWEATT